MALRRTTYPPARLYEAVLHLRKLGHDVRCHDRRRRLHWLDDAVLSEAALLERAMCSFRPKAYGRPRDPH